MTSAGAWHLIHCTSLPRKQSWPDVWSLWASRTGLDSESIQTVSAKRKGRPPTPRSMQQAATLWLLALPTLPDGGLITGTACGSNPWVALPVWTQCRTLSSVFHCTGLSHCCLLAPSVFLILWSLLEVCLAAHPVSPSLCCSLYSNIREIHREILNNSADGEQEEQFMNLFHTKRCRPSYVLLSAAKYSPEGRSCRR